MLARLFLAIMIVGLTGCAVPPVAPIAPSLTGALLLVRLEKKLEFPDHVTLEVSAVDGANPTAFKGRLLRSFPGAYADYPVALALPAGSYRLNALHNDQSGKSFHFAFKVPINVESGNPVYLGRMVIGDNASNDVRDIKVEDQYDEDTLLFKTAIAELKNLDLKKSPLTQAQLVELNSVGSSTPKSQIVASPMVTESETDLPPPVKKAFGRFLRLKIPRAFAVGNNGAVFGMHSGKGAVDAALKACNKQDRNQECRVFAVDDTLMSTAR